MLSLCGAKTHSEGRIRKKKSVASRTRLRTQFAHKMLPRGAYGDGYKTHEAENESHRRTQNADCVTKLSAHSTTALHYSS